MTRAALALAAQLAVLALPLAAARAADAADPYDGLVLLGGDSHEHAATFWMLERLAKEPPLPGFGMTLHEHGSSAAAFDAMRSGGYDWGAVVHHDTNFPGRMANVCIDPASEKYRWWQAHVDRGGFPDAAGPAGAKVVPPADEALALARVALAKTAEGPGGFLAFSGREFTDVADTPVGVGARQGGHKIVILPDEVHGMCGADGLLDGDEYCRDEYHLYRWAVGASDPPPVLIQAHPGLPDRMDLRPVHPKNAPGGFSDAFVQGIEVSNHAQDPQYEPAYQQALKLGYRLFPAFGSDSHNATYKGYEASARKSATLCWATARTRRALLEALHARRCYYATAWKPELRFALRAAGKGAWQPLGAQVDVPDARADVRLRAVNDPRNAAADPRLGKRFDLLELVGAANPNQVLASRPCARAADGRDVCELALDAVHVPDGAIYPRITMRDPKPEGCRSAGTPKLLVNCGKVVIGGAIYVNWERYRSRTPYRACRFGRDDVPCGEPGCLPAALDRDQDGYPNGCDVCPDRSDPAQADADKDGFGDACPR